MGREMDRVGGAGMLLRDTCIMLMVVKLQADAEYSSWESMLDELQRLIELGVNMCVSDESMKPDEAASYLTSGQCQDRGFAPSGAPCSEKMLGPLIYEYPVTPPLTPFTRHCRGRHA